jgi:uncharacterized membrane protein YdbT with pleckstrin-like domain
MASAPGDLAPKSRATALVERMLRIPPEPEPPAGAPESIRVFRAAKGYYTYRLVQWLAKEIVTGAGLAFGVSFIASLPAFPYKFLLDIVEAFGVASYVVMVPITYLMVHLDYQLRWYVVTDRSLRIREGLVRIGEKTMSFANVQNIAIRQGPFQRLLGIADVEVRTAGGGGGGGGETGHGKSRETPMHLGYFRGVDNAEEIRDAVLLRVRQLRDSGLGDPDADHAAHHALAPVATTDADVLAAARELLAEARALRQSAPAG